MKTKGQRKAEDRRKLRHRGDSGLTTMMGKLCKKNYGAGVKHKNLREPDEDTELDD
jgi:hypothetical protein